MQPSFAATKLRARIFCSLGVLYVSNWPNVPILSLIVMDKGDNPCCYFELGVPVVVCLVLCWC